MDTSDISRNISAYVDSCIFDFHISTDILETICADIFKCALIQTKLWFARKNSNECLSEHFNLSYYESEKGRYSAQKTILYTRYVTCEQYRVLCDGIVDGSSFSHTLMSIEEIDLYSKEIVDLISDNDRCIEILEKMYQFMIIILHNSLFDRIKISSLVFIIIEYSS